jgi:peroxiredoxin
MTLDVRVGSTAPDLKVSEWVQGGPVQLRDLLGDVVVIEVFQVNCPGCFIYGLPEAIDVFQKYDDKGVKVLGLATAFEDYDKNNLENLKLLLTKYETIGDTYLTLKQQTNILDGNKLSYKIPFPVAMDLIVKESLPVKESRLMKFIQDNVPDYELYHPKDKEDIKKRAIQYFESKEFSATTFEEYALKGTPSSILIDKKGKLRNVSFGSNGSLMTMVETLLRE